MSTARNYFIISKSFGHFFKASIVIALAEQFCQIIDLILVGNLVSADAFSALDLAIPIETAITGLMLLLIGGASAIACRHIGNQEFELADRVQTISVLSSSAIALIISICGLLCYNSIVAYLCKDQILAYYLTQYLRIYFIGLVPMALYYSLSQIVDIDGSPMVVTTAVVIACALDLILDIVFMKFMGLGVVGEALANIASYMFPVLYFIPYINSKTCRFSFRVTKGNNFKLLADNIKSGVPYCLPYITTFIFGLIVNMVVLDRYGSNGVYIWSVAYQVLMVGFMLMDYTGKTILVTLGSMLYGCYDIDGLEILVRKILFATTVIIMALIGLVYLMPGQVVAMFGDSSAEILANSSQYIKIAILFLIPFSYCSIKVYLYQVLGRRFAASMQMIMLIGVTALSLVIFYWNDPSQLGFVMLGSCAVYYIANLIYTIIIRKRHPDFSFSFLIPHKEINKLYLSVPYSKEGMNNALPQIESFLADCQMDESMRFGINICCEEMILGLVSHNTDKTDYFFDFLIFKEENTIKIRVQDVGDPFNPVRHFTKTAAESYLAGEDMHLSLQIINKICQKLEYNYMYEQNTIYMSFGSRAKLGKID